MVGYGEWSRFYDPVVWNYQGTLSMKNVRIGSVVRFIQWNRTFLVVGMRFNKMLILGNMKIPETIPHHIQQPIYRAVWDDFENSGYELVLE